MQELFKLNAYGLLDLQNQNINSDLLKQYFLELTNGKVKNLNLSRNGLFDKGAAILADIINSSPSLETLKIADCAIGDEGFQQLSYAIANSKTLSLVDMSLNNLTDLGIEYFVKNFANFQNKRLMMINFSSNFLISDDSAKSLAKVIPITGITQIDLSNTTITDEGAQEFLLHVKKPCEIILCDTCVSEDILEKIKKLAMQPISQTLSNDNSPVTSAKVIGLDLGRLFHSTTSNYNIVSKQEEHYSEKEYLNKELTSSLLNS